MLKVLLWDMKFWPLNPIAVRKSIIIFYFCLSECSRVKTGVCLLELLILLHSEWPKLNGIIAILSAVGFTKKDRKNF